MSDNKGSFANRSGKGGGMSTGDAWRSYLAYKVGTSGSQGDLERMFLRKNGGKGETLNDLWGSFLNSKGFTTGTLRERKQRYMETGSIA